MRLFLGCLIGLCNVSLALAAVPAFQAFPPAREAAARSGVPLVVCVHGASWQRASRTFVEEVWRSAALRRSLREQMVLGEVGIGQALDEQARQQQGVETKGWNDKTVKTFPALQFYSPDGHLLRTIAGEEFFAMGKTPETVAAQLDRSLPLGHRHSMRCSGRRVLPGPGRPVLAAIGNRFRITTASAGMPLSERFPFWRPPTWLKVRWPRERSTSAQRLSAFRA